MSLSEAVDAAVAAVRRRPGDLLPWYVLGAAVPAIARVVPFLAIAIAYVYLATTGRLATIVAELQELSTEPPDPNADPEAFEAWASQFDVLVDQLFTPTLIVLAVVTTGAALVVWIVLYAAVAAGQLTACSARLRGNRGVAAGFAGARRYWLRFLGLYLLELLAWLAVLLTIGLAVGVVAGIVVLSTGSGGPALLVGAVAGLVILAALLAVRAVFAFASVAVVVDDTTAVDAVTNALGFVRSQPLEAGVYYAVALGTTIALAVLSAVITFVDVATLLSLVTPLVVFPALDLLKTAVYNDYRRRLEPPTAPVRSLGRQLRDGVRYGWSEMVAFVRETPGTHALVVALALGGFWAGWAAAAPVEGTVETSISARLVDHNPLAATLEFFANNWLVALTTALSGVVLVVPAVASLLFNGLAMGVFARTETEPTELLAFVVPHGVFEIPAIFIASALGIRLGLIGWRTLRGDASRTDLADALERAFWVLVGVGVLLAVAAAIEGFVSPYYSDLLF
ncbi:stage II sporulation protein M [Haloterrigena sp. SYSU A121-1]|uniref:Stage II sporulation protein M n=1 Tax=Haloterrigena gelatinilytica TaxID=2741724 RepID=A0A8J8KCU4_9EURY|nr:stage II sporulation protein M [Haloterrigena gelatinilytica]NUB89473.1 stage II sporulation protein M [Haloterrigena gelatinilytica]